MEHKIYLVDGVWVAKHLFVFQFFDQIFPKHTVVFKVYCWYESILHSKITVCFPAVIFAFIASMKKKHIIRFHIYLQLQSLNQKVIKQVSLR